MSLDELRDALDGAEPAGFEHADPAHLAALADAVADARHRHRVALRESTEEALGHVPRLLRGPVRRIVGL